MKFPGNVTITTGNVDFKTGGDIIIQRGLINWFKPGQRTTGAPEPPREPVKAYPAHYQIEPPLGHGQAVDYGPIQSHAIDYRERG